MIRMKTKTRALEGCYEWSRDCTFKEKLERNQEVFECLSQKTPGYVVRRT